MSDRWKVYRTGCTDHFLWWADNESLPDYRGRFFGNHAEALAYADRQARTIEVTLPSFNGRAEIRPGSLHDQPIVIERRENGDFRVSEGELDKGLLGLGVPFVDLAPDEIEPVALALLAAADHAEKEAQ